MFGSRPSELKEKGGATYGDADFGAAYRFAKQFLGDESLAGTAFRRGYAYALYRHGVSRDVLADIGFWSTESKAMDVYHGVSADDRCDHVSRLTAGSRFALTAA